MAVIQKIRNKYGKVAGAVIGISLVSFIVSDARNGSFGGLFGGHDSHVMTVDGSKIESKEYEQRVKEYELLTQIYSNRGPITEETRAQIREQVLQSVAFETVVGKMCDKLGIETSEQEKKDLFYSPNAHQLVRNFNFEGQQIFNNPETKQFDPGRVKGFEDELAKNGQKMDPYGKFTEQWAAVKAYVLRMSRIDKFNALMSASVYTPGYEAKAIAADMAQMASIKYVKVPYSAIPDADVKVSDDEIKAYMQKHKGFYETEQASRGLEYLSFEIIPAAADSARAREALEEMKDEFSKAKDNKTFVGNKSDDMNVYSEAYVSKKTFASQNADTIMAQPAGTIYGPYQEAGSYRITKIVDKQILPDSAKCRHILVKVKDGGKEILSDAAAKSKIDSIVTAINNGAKFDSMVAKFSDDDGSKATNGEYWFNLQQRPQISKEFGDVIFTGHVGEKKVVKVDNSKNNGYVGYHYIEVLEQKGAAPTVQVATITKNLLPSDSTVNAIYGKSNDFAAKSTDAATFDANAKTAGTDKRVAENIRENSFSIQGIGSAREIIKWAFTHKVGEISTAPFRINDQRYVVAKLTNIEEKGLMPITPGNRPMLEQKVKEEKKAEMIINKFKGGSLESIAQATAQTVGQSDSVTLGGGVIPGIGYEPKVSGYAFCPALAPNAVSPGIKSQGGVYFISLNNRATRPSNPATEQMEMFQMRKNQESQVRNFVGQALQQTITKKADIKYNISTF